MIAKKRNELSVWEPYLDKCLMGMDTTFQKLFNIGSLQGKSMLEVEKTLRMMGINGGLKENILKVADFKYREDVLEADLKDLHELVSTYGQGQTAPQNFFLAKKVWYRIKDQAPQNYFLKKLLEVLAALRVGNDAWAKRALGEAIFIDPYQYALEINPIHLSPEKLSSYKSDLTQALKILNEKLKKEPIVQMYINTLAGQTNDDAILKVRDELGFRWSLVDIRNFIKDRIVGSSYPHVWFVALSGRTTQNEIDNYFESALDVQKMEKWEWYKMWLFRSFLPNDENLRKIIFEKLDQFEEELTLHRKLLLTQMAENQTIKRELKDKIDLYSKPTFQLKREFYRSLFYSGEAPYFALFQLWSMGDISDESLLWLAI